MSILDEILEDLDPDGEWEAEPGYGIDANLIHSPCGTMVEQDAKECPECHVANPLREVM